MAKLLGSNAHLVSYGAMSKKPLSLPTSLFIFKNLTSHGFWQSRWSTEKSPSEKEDLLRSLTEMMIAGEVRVSHSYICCVVHLSNCDGRS